MSENSSEGKSILSVTVDSEVVLANAKVLRKVLEVRIFGEISNYFRDILGDCRLRFQRISSQFDRLGRLNETCSKWDI